jgi:hypothetical protein
MKTTAATSNLQSHLQRLEHWWCICANETKSTQVTFTLRQENYPPVYVKGRLITHNDIVTWSPFGPSSHMENAHPCQKETTRPFA